MSDNQKWSILQGDALKVLGTFAPNTFDAVITDPPYASGGRTQAEKNKSTARKYSSMGENAPPPFDGDAKDQRSWTRWAAEWLYEARKVCKSGAPVCMFIDWRQLPAATDALQWAGWIWRGTAVWDKGNSRPQKGRFRQQAEYIVWGSNGDMPISRPVPCLPGVFKYGNPQSRIHLTEKPLQLMRDIVRQYTYQFLNYDGSVYAQGSWPPGRNRAGIFWTPLSAAVPRCWRLCRRAIPPPVSKSQTPMRSWHGNVSEPSWKRRHDLLGCLATLLAKTGICRYNKNNRIEL